MQTHLLLRQKLTVLASTLLDALVAMAERADLAALKKLVASAGGLEEKDFTSDSYKDLKDAMDALQKTSLMT